MPQEAIGAKGLGETRAPPFIKKKLTQNEQPYEQVYGEFNMYRLFTLLT